MRMVVAAVLALGAVASVAMPARAFRTFADDPFCAEEGCTETGVPQARMPVPYELDRAGSDDLPFPDVERAVTASFTDWAEPMCTSLEVRYDGATTTGVVWDDDRNVVKWIESGWAALGYSTFELGVTTHQLTFTGGRWIIGSADIELNGVDYEWRLETTSPFDDQATVGDVVRHEAGHVMGLDHPCEFGVSGVPECDVVGPTLGATPVMWPRSRDGGRNALEADDIAGICWQYPATGMGCPAVPCRAGERCEVGVCVADTSPGTDAGTVADDAGPGWWMDVENDGGVVDGGGGEPSAPPSGDGSGGCGVTGRAPSPFAASMLLLVAVAVRRRRSF
jgi:hypothetical protein